MANPSRELLEADAGPDPLALFGRWFDEAVAAQLPQPEAMTLATATLAGKPSSRVVLLRGYDEAGFMFYTNYLSQKGHELAANPQAALLLFWAELGRQVRIDGVVEKLTAAENDAYFHSRPYSHRLGAWASPQSQVIPNREILDNMMAELSARFPDEVPRPSHWGGYRLRPDMLEFWQFGDSRLHDRLRYRRQDNEWLRERLAP